MAAQGQSAKLTFQGDRVWIVYTAGVGVQYLMYGIDAAMTTVATQGVLSGTGTGTFTLTNATGFPLTTSTMTVDDEDMTVTISGVTVTISARGINSTKAVSHIVTAPVLYAPAGIKRVNTFTNTTRCGRYADSGVLTPGTHTLTVLPNPRSGGHSAILDGAMVFYGDGGALPGEGKGVRVWEGGHAGYFTAHFSGALGTTNGLWTDAMENIDADLVIIQFGPNESGSGYSPTQMQANLIDLVNNVRARSPNNPSIVFSVGWVPGFVTEQQWQTYRDAMISGARLLGCGIFDLTSKMERAPAVGFNDLYTDAVHNTDYGSLQTAGELLLDIANVDEFDTGHFNVPLYFKNQSPAPTLGVSGGGLVYEETGVLKHIDPAGNIEYLSQQEVLTTFSRPGILTATPGTGRLRFPWAIRVLGVTAAVNTAPTGTSLILDVNKNGTSIFATTPSNRPTIAAAANATTVEPVPDTVNLAAGDYLTVDVDQIGSGTAGSDLTVFVRYRRTYGV
jgi:hypothetical protein